MLSHAENIVCSYARWCLGRVIPRSRDNSVLRHHTLLLDAAALGGCHPHVVIILTVVRARPKYVALLIADKHVRFQMGVLFTDRISLVEIFHCGRLPFRLAAPLVESHREVSHCVVLHLICEVQLFVLLSCLESRQRGGIGSLVAQPVLDLEVLSLDLFLELFIELVGSLLRHEVEVSTFLLAFVHAERVAFLREEVTVGVETDFVVLHQLVFISLLVQPIVLVHVRHDILTVWLTLL